MSGDEDPGRHPRSAEWEARFRRRIPGTTRIEQVATVLTWLRRDLSDSQSISAVTYGTYRPSVLEAALGPASLPLAARLASAFEPLTGCGWAVEHLRRADGPPDDRGERDA